MPRFFNPAGRSTYGIGLCARCSKKFSIEDLVPDPNSPGLMVCRKDLDLFDPWRLPPRPVETESLPFTRPDTDISIEGGVPPVDGSDLP